MTDKFSKLNETFNTDGNIVPKVEVSVEKHQKKLNHLVSMMPKKIMTIREEICIH